VVREMPLMSSTMTARVSQNTCSMVSASVAIRSGVSIMSSSSRSSVARLLRSDSGVSSFSSGTAMIFSPATLQNLHRLARFRKRPARDSVTA